MDAWWPTMPRSGVGFGLGVAPLETDFRRSHQAERRDRTLSLYLFAGIVFGRGASGACTAPVGIPCGCVVSAQNGHENGDLAAGAGVPCFGRSGLRFPRKAEPPDPNRYLCNWVDSCARFHCVPLRVQGLAAVRHPIEGGGLTGLPSSAATREEGVRGNQTRGAGRGHRLHELSGAHG